MAQVPSPTIRARRLRRELRQLREHAGLTAEDVAKALKWHRTKIIRFEVGHSRVMLKDIEPLLDLYKVSDDEREALVALVRQARQKGWWSAYGDVLPDNYVGFEAEATGISTFESLYVPGLLQTEEYLRAILRAGRITKSPDEADRVVAARLSRKVLLARDTPPHMWVILDEAVVRRVVGNAKVMRVQIARLIEACDMPTVELQILPFEAGAHAAMGGPFTLLDYADPVLDPTVVYTDNDISTQLLEEEEQVARYRLMFDHLRAKALDPDRSVSFLAKVARDYPD